MNGCGCSSQMQDTQHASCRVADSMSCSLCAKAKPFASNRNVLQQLSLCLPENALLLFFGTDLERELLQFVQQLNTLLLQSRCQRQMIKMLSCAQDMHMV